jgi:hypothetical protein
MVHLDFKATNNMAEDEALLYGLSTALSLGVQRLLVKGDSQLIIKQVRGVLLQRPPVGSLPAPCAWAGKGLRSPGPATYPPRGERSGGRLVRQGLHLGPGP